MVYKKQYSSYHGYRSAEDTWLVKRKHLYNAKRMHRERSNQIRTSTNNGEKTGQWNHCDKDGDIVNLIISEFSKLVKTENTAMWQQPYTGQIPRLEYVEKIYQEKQDNVWEENEMKTLQDFSIQTEQQLWATGQVLLILKKDTWIEGKTNKVGVFKIEIKTQ